MVKGSPLTPSPLHPFSLSSAMPILIDGYNLMHAAGLMKPRFGPGGLERARRALLGLLAGSLGDEAAQTTVVFDARTAAQPPLTAEEPPTARQEIRVQFAPGEEGADALIEKIIRIDSAPKRLTVVSADHRIQAAARRRGARSVASDLFLQELLARRRQRQRAGRVEPPEKPQSSPDRESWIREFEDLIDEADLRELAGPFNEDV